MPDYKLEDGLRGGLVKLRASHDQEKAALRTMLRTMQAEKKDQEASALLAKINEIEEHMLIMEGCCVGLIAETERLVLNKSTTEEQIKSWAETVTEVIVFLENPNDLNKIKSLERHAVKKCEALSQADIRLQRDSDQRLGKIFTLVGLALLVVGGIALAVSLSVATLGAGALVALTITAAFGLELGALGLGVGVVGLIKGYDAGEPGLNTPENVKVAQETIIREEPARKISNSVKNLSVHASTLFAVKAEIPAQKNLSPDDPKNEKTPGQDIKNNQP
ncbi:MAG: hypothetical protein ACHP65_06500 [Legionellales bacterium]